MDLVNTRLKVVAIYDSKAEAFLRPQMVRTRGEAIRILSDTVNKEDSLLHKHPGDFTLFEVAEFDERTGRYHPLDAFVNLGCAIEFVESSPSVPKVIPRVSAPVEAAH